MKQLLLFVAVAFLFNVSAFAQAPNFAYAPAANSLTIGTPFTITPINNAGGGLVPATIYGQVTTLAAGQFNIPYAVVGDGAGNFYVADANNNAIRQVTSAGVVTTLAGSGAPGSANGPIANASFNNPQGIARDAAGNLYVSDYGNHMIRKISADQTTVSNFYQYDPTFRPAGLCFDNSGNLIVADEDESLIIKVDPNGIGHVIAGSTYGYTDATGTAAQFAYPEDVQVDAAGNIFVADYLNNVVRKIDINNVVTTFAGNQANPPGFADGTGSAALFNQLTGLAMGSGNVMYVADLLNNDIRRIMPDGTVSTVAGDPGQVNGAANGVGTAASFFHPVDLYIDGTGTGWVADARNNAIRMINLTGYTIDKPLPAGLIFDSTNGKISGTPTVALATPTIYTVTAYNAVGYASTTITLSMVNGTPGTAPIIAYSPASNYVPVGTPFTISPTNTGGPVPAMPYGQVTTLAGSGTNGFTDATGTAAQFNIPYAVVGDGAGNFYVADANNNAIRQVTSAGVVTTLAGSGAPGSANGPIANASFNNPQGIARDATGNLYVSDYGNHMIRKISADQTTVSNFYQYDPTFRPAGLCFDNSGNLIVADEDESLIIKVDPNGIGHVIAGSTYGYTDATGTAAQFAYPEDVQVDAAGNIFVADYLNNVVRKIDINNVVTTFAGNQANPPGFADGTGSAALFNQLTGLAMGSGNVMYVADLLNNDIRRIMPDGTVSTVAGDPGQVNGAANGVGTAASFFHPVDLYIDGTGTGWVADARNNAIRMINLTGYTIDKPLPAGLIFDSANGKISGTLTAALIGATYNVTAYNAYGYFTTPVTLSSYNNWTGNGTDWNTPANWSANVVPIAGDIAQIGIVPYNGTAQPDLGTSTTVGSVRFGTYNTPALTIETGKTLTITNDLTVNSASTVIINGPGTIALGGTSVINSTASLTASLNAIIALMPSATLTNNGTFTLASDINGSASIDAIPAGASVNGPVSVQRYLNGGNLRYRGYRLLSSPVYAATANGNNVYSINYITNNSFVSCTDCATTATTKSGNPALYLYREDMIGNNTSFTSGNFRGIKNIDQTPAYNYLVDVDGGPFNIPVGNGFLYFFRGDKTTLNPYTTTTTPIATTLTTTGTLIQGPVTVADWFTPLLNTLSYTPASAGVAGYNCVGNPYACAIDWNTFTTNNDGTGIYGTGLVGGATPAIQVYDPISQTFGSYQKGLPPSNAYATNIISSGQGFFVQANSPGAQLIFNETSKSAQSQNTGVQSLMSKQAAAVAGLQYIRLQFGLDSTKGEQTVINFNNQAPLAYSAAVDVRHLQGTGQTSLSTQSSDLADLSIHSVPFPGQLQSQVIKLNINATANGTYILKIRDLVAVPKLYEIWLMDAYQKDSVNLSANNLYSVDINKADSASFGTNRLSLVIRQNPALAYQLLSFTASKMPSAPQVQVVWKTVNEQNYTNFTVERSIDDGKTFDILGGLQGTGAGTYSLLDKNPITGQNLYRLKQEDINNTITYSNVVTIQYSDLSNNSLDNLNLFPNPASSSINLAIIATPDQTATYNIKFVNSSGLVVKQVNSSQPSWQGNISSLKPGTYFVNVFSNKDQSLVGRTKFVKL